MRSKQIIAAVLVLIVLAMATHKAIQHDAGLLKFKVRDNIAYGYGGTDARSVGVVRDLIREHPQVTTLVLKNMPGTSDATMNLRVARRIRSEGLNTHLDSNSFIASGAVDLFLAGNERTMECGALIGVHTVYFLAEGGLVRGEAFYPAKTGYDTHEKQAKAFLRDMGIDPAFYDFTRNAAKPEELYYLTPEDINRFNLLTEPLNCD
jgi:hypothetical protein